MATPLDKIASISGPIWGPGKGRVIARLTVARPPLQLRSEFSLIEKLGAFAPPRLRDLVARATGTRRVCFIVECKVQNATRTLTRRGRVGLVVGKRKLY